MQAVGGNIFLTTAFFYGFNITIESINYMFLKGLIVYERELGNLVWPLQN